MRISTGMMFDLGVSSINKQSASLLHLAQQVSSGRRILTPSDDPVAAARALEVQQAQDITSQYTTNQSNAKSALGLSDAALSSVGDLLNRVRQLAVYGGNGSLATSDRKSIADELTANFDQLLGLANSTDGTGQYLFSGYMGSTQPFAGTVANGVIYFGDSGQRLLQASASRQLQVSDAGNDVFMQIPGGNGYFATNYATTNTGTGVIDTGSITSPSTWNGLVDKSYDIRFWKDPATSTTYYDIVNTTTGSANIGKSLLTGLAAASPPATFPGGLRTYASGQAIQLKNQGTEPAFDLGAYVTITGSPTSSGATPDTFTITPAASQDVFKTISNLIAALSSSQAATPAGNAALANQIGSALTNLDQANNNVLRIRSLVGSRLNEVDALGNTNSALSLQYQQTLSNLQDLDYAKAISDLTRNQTGLTAAQKTFQMTTQLSLFNYLP
jgi:flagellar hook-associated protein 3 FlgL